MNKFVIFFLALLTALILSGCCSREYLECLEECKILSGKNSVVLTINHLDNSSVRRYEQRLDVSRSMDGSYRSPYRGEWVTYHSTKVYLSNGETCVFDFKLTDTNRKVIKRHAYSPREKMAEDGRIVYIPEFRGYSYHLK